MSIGMIRKRKKQRKTEQEVYICKICGKEYKTEKGLLKHIEAKHKDGEQHG